MAASLFDDALQAWKLQSDGVKHVALHGGVEVRHLALHTE